MFTLSDKQRVINTPNSVRVFSAANVERTTSAAVANGDKLLIEGFGHFDIDSITNIKLRRGRAAVNESKQYAVTAPAGIAIGDAVEVRVEMDSSRYQSELAITSRLGGSRTLVLATKPLTAVGASDIRAAIVTAYNDFAAEFSIGQLPFAITGATTNIVLTTLAEYTSVSFKRVEIRRSNQGIGSQAWVALAATTLALGFEGENLGKFLEESIRMATPGNNDPYGVDTNDTRVDLRGTYTALYFEVSAPYTENLSTLAADHGSLAATHKFVLYLNESTSMAANSAVAKLAAVALLRATALATLTATVTAATLSLAAEKSEVMIIADASSVATVAAFIA